MTKKPALAALSAAGVLVWPDDLSRDRLTSANSEQMIDTSNVVAVDTNPSIFRYPAYSDTRYIIELIAPHIVSTIPEKALEALADHSVIAGDFVTGTVSGARTALGHVTAVGVDLEDVFSVLENDAVAKFEASWRQLLDAYPTAPATAEDAHGRGKTVH
ncbi:transaldolase family protein [Nocardia sp. NPDC049220]|uniref:transaldolase family protein n=1 Tax=Nocardia sp. NPDC049220 TaxID=3155273 RepID=UPI0033D2C08F